MTEMKNNHSKTGNIPGGYESRRSEHVKQMVFTTRSDKHGWKLRMRTSEVKND